MSSKGERASMRRSEVENSLFNKFTILWYNNHHLHLLITHLKDKVEKRDVIIFLKT